MQQAPENLTVEGLNVNVGPYSLAPTVRRNAAGDVGRVPGAGAGGRFFRSLAISRAKPAFSGKNEPQIAR